MDIKNLILQIGNYEIKQNINLFKENEANYVLIPPGMTSMLQSLDTHVNKVFKSNVRNEYDKWLIKNNNAVINDNDIIDFIL